MTVLNSIRKAGVKLAGIALGCALLVGAASCRNAMTVPGMDWYVGEYVRLAVGLGQRDVDSLDYYSGPSAMTTDIADSPPTLASIHSSVMELMDKIKQTRPANDQEKAREIFLAKQLEAMASRVDVITGARSSFDEETKSSFGVVVPVDYDDKAILSVKTEVQRLLPGSGSLADRYQNFDNRFVIPRKLVPAVMTRALEACRAETLSHIHLPAGEGVKVEYVYNRPWSAYSRYQGGYRSVVQINMDYALTVDRALNLACHEAYPGHHTYNSIRDTELVRGRGLKEYSVQPTYSPQSMFSESIATLAMDVAFPHEKRLGLERDVLFPIVGLDKKSAALYLRVEELVAQLHPVEPIVAREYLDGRLEFERAGSELERDALMAHPEAALKYMNEFRSYVTTYTYGRDLVAEQLQRSAGQNSEARWKTYAKWMTDDPKLPVLHHEQRATSGLTHIGGG